jgi:hypothetical protein
MDSCNSCDVHQSRRGGSSSGSQKEAVNGACVEMSLAVGRRGFAQRARIYCKAVILLDQLSGQLYRTHHFTGTEPRPAPRRCLGCPTVEALTTYTVTEFHPCIIRVDGPVGSKPGGGFIKRAALAVKGLR